MPFISLGNDEDNRKNEKQVQFESAELNMAFR